MRSSYEWLEEAHDYGWSASELKRQIEAEQLKQLAPLPPGVYGVIYADPPWQYDFAETDNRKIENHYPTMPVEDIESMGDDIPAAPDSVLFLWATSPKLREGLSVVEAWGFEYVTCMIWVKNKIGMGYYARQQHELLLIGRRGALPVPLPENRPSSVFYGERTEHSRKPKDVYDLIDQMYPDQPKLELFARNTREGWESWGNDAALEIVQ